MWQVLIDHFRRYPAQERVVRLMIEHGLRIHEGAICAGIIEIADTAIGRAADVDRRIVRSTVETIMADARLSRVFTRLAPTLHLKDVAPDLGCGVIEIVVADARQPGILTGVSKVISDHRISIRQANVEDPDFTENPKLFVVTESRVPGAIIPLLQAVPGVKGVTVY
ncbi:MAG: amino acid-binding protein [Thermoplasmatota archaeon]